MLRNKTDKKQIILQDQLYNEILNGFEEFNHYVRHDESKVTFTKDQRLRINRVGFETFQNQYIKNFVNENFQDILNYAEEVKRHSIERYYVILKEHDEEDILEGEKITEDSFNIMKVINVVSDIRTLIRVIKKLNSGVGMAKDFIYKSKAGGADDKRAMLKTVEKFEFSIKALIDGVLPPSIMSIIELADSKIFNKMWDGFFEVLVGSIGESAAWAALSWAASAIGGVGGLIVGGARVAQIANRMNNIVKRMKKLQKYSKLIYNGSKISMTIADVIFWDKQDEMELERYIDKNITQKHLIKYRNQTLQQIANINPASQISESLATASQDISSHFIDLNNVMISEDDVEEKQEYVDRSVRRTGLNVNVYKLPSQNGKYVEVGYDTEDLNQVLETIYGIKLTEKSKKIIANLPSMKLMKGITKFLQTLFEKIMQQQLKLIDVVASKNVHEIKEWRDKIYQWEEFESKLLDSLESRLDLYERKKYLDDMGEAILENEQRYEVSRSQWFIQNKKKDDFFGHGYILNENSREPFRALFQNQYGYLTGLKIDVKNDNKEAQGYDFLTNQITFDKGNQKDYDVIYLSKPDELGYKGYTTLIESLFYFINDIKMELQIEESIQKNIDILYNIITRRVVS